MMYHQSPMKRIRSICKKLHFFMKMMQNEKSINIEIQSIIIISFQKIFMNKIIFIACLCIGLSVASFVQDSIVTLEQAQKDDILAMANQFRCKVFDAYKNVFDGVEHPAKLAWNEVLEQKAQESTDACALPGSFDGFTFTLRSSFNKFVSPVDLPVQSYFGQQLKRGLGYLTLEDLTNYSKSNELEELSAHVLSDKVSSFACAATTCSGEDRFDTYFTCFFNVALEAGEGLVTGLHHVQGQQTQEDDTNEPAPQPQYEGDGLLTPDDLQSILDWHNKYRKQFNQGIFAQDEDTLWPKALNIPKLARDEQLEQQAQEVADRCVFEHSDKSFLDEANIGENLYASTWKANMKDVVHRWIQEGKNGDAIPISYALSFSNSRVEGEQIGHFSQVIWENTEKVGCARKYCPNFKSLNGETRAEFIVVCQYFPAGNVLGQPIYTVDQSSDNNSGSNSGNHGHGNSGSGSGSGSGKGNSGSGSGSGKH